MRQLIAPLMWHCNSRQLGFRRSICPTASHPITLQFIPATVFPPNFPLLPRLQSLQSETRDGLPGVGPAATALQSRHDVRFHKHRAGAIFAGGRRQEPADMTSQLAMPRPYAGLLERERLAVPSKRAKACGKGPLHARASGSGNTRAVGIKRATSWEQEQTVHPPLLRKTGFANPRQHHNAAPSGRRRSRPTESQCRRTQSHPSPQVR